MSGWRLTPYRVPALAAGALLLAAPASAQVVRGRVLDRTSEQPIASAAVALLDRSGAVKRIGISGPGGEYSVRVPEPGIYSFRVEAPGYNKLEDFAFKVYAGQELELDLPLWSLTELAPVVVTAEAGPDAPGPLRGFYERMESGMRGQFLDREAIEQKGALKFTDILRLTPGVNIVRHGAGGYTVRMKTGVGLSDCPPILFVDNVRWGEIDVGEGPDRELLAADIEAIEVYTGSQVPIEFGTTGSECGVVVVWNTRGPDRY